MELGVTLGLMFIVAGLFYVLPAVLVIASGRVRGNDLALWVAAVLFTSWLGFVAFMTATTIDRRQRRATAGRVRHARTLPVLDISDHSPH